jgi:alpha-tubulin suppressor-like RCC1 family protein
MALTCSNAFPKSAGQGDGNSTAVVPPHAVRVDGRLGNDIEAVAAGVNHSLVMSTTGRVSAIGDNSFEQLGGTPSREADRPPAASVAVLSQLLIGILETRQHKGTEAW